MFQRNNDRFSNLRKLARLEYLNARKQSFYRLNHETSAYQIIHISIRQTRNFHEINLTTQLLP